LVLAIVFGFNVSRIDNIGVEGVRAAGSITSFTADKLMIWSGATVNLTWASSATSCVVTQNLHTGTVGSGSGNATIATAAIDAQTIFTLTCDGDTANASRVTVAVAYFKAFSARTFENTRADLYWSVPLANSCTITNDRNADTFTGSSKEYWLSTSKLTSNTSYTLSCTDGVTTHVLAPYLVSTVPLAGIQFNGDFEGADPVSSTSSVLTGWTVNTGNTVSGAKNAKGGTFSVEAGNGSSKALKLSTTNLGYPVAFSAPIPVKLGDYLKISLDYKATGVPAGTNLSQMVGFEEYRGQNVDARAWPWLLQSISPNDLDGIWHSLEVTIPGIKAPDIDYIRLKLSGIYGIEGASITYDNIVVAPTSVEPTAAETKGCVNSSTSKCVDFGATDEIGIKPTLPEYISAKKSEGTTTYREILNKQTVFVSIPSWNIDSNGLPNTDLMLEIRYKDTFAADPLPADYYNYYQDKSQYASVKTRIDFTKPESYTGNLLGLGEFGDNTWKTVQVVLPKTNWQMIKSIDGSYVVRIGLPTPIVAGASLSLPIDYVSLSEISANEVKSFEQKQRDSLGLREVNYTPVNPLPTISGDFTWFTSPSTEQIFPNYYPKSNQIKKAITLQSVLDETEPGNFSIITKNSVSDVSFSIPDLVSDSGAIPSSDINLYKVMYENKHWSNNTANGSTYGLQPDRYEKFDKISIGAGTTQQFYFTIAVPNNVAGGVYSGTIKVMVGGVETATIPVSIDILPIKLEDPGYIPYLYHNPNDISRYYRKNDPLTASDIEYNNKLFSDIVSHDYVATKAFGRFAPTVENGAITKFDFTDFETKLKQSIAQGVVKDKAFYWNLDPLASDIIASLGLNTGTKWDKLSNPAFTSAFLLWIDGIEKIALDNNVQIIYSVCDEPGNILDRRTLSDKLYPLLRQKNVTTWTTYWKNCEDPVPCAECTPCPECVLNSAGLNSLPSLASFIDYKVYGPSYLTANNVINQPSSFGYYTTSLSQLRNPVYARFLQGLYPIKTGAKVVGNYAYGDFVGSPYNEFDVDGGARANNAAPDWMMVYPSWDGQLIPSTAWEANREGIKDAKYITELRKLIKLNPTNTVAVEANSFLNTAFANISIDFINNDQLKSDDFGYAKEIVRQISTSGDKNDIAVFDNIRSEVFNYIKLLSKPVTTISADKSNVAAGGIIELTVTIANQYTSTMKGVAVSVPLPADTAFLSAGNGGALVGSTVKWPAISQLLPQGTTEVTFKVRVN